MKSNLIGNLVLDILWYVKKNIKYIVLLLLAPLSEIKAIFYNYEEKVSWYLFSDNRRFLCNVIEDYSNIIIIGTVFYYSIFVKLDLLCNQIILFLFILNAFDLVFLGLMDNAYYLIKIFLAPITYYLCMNSKRLLDRFSVR